ncbi:hypothetical protein POX_a00820 [Penicillium oxalicum]|uniref:RRM domain-containing protein n=1 Tax=Penicillium oxalicum (strain 114-2 / CGMCC 5302) TaxID=933388 RepID=S8BGF9_PENO1|nr:hypothetical protein POX_a00820 [Penicillium oxalicum]EPS34207.1 hypothetical protein PDE_09171 [Penicillium oxalicum 114-2]KAI2794229.1 hypothetical protein POX_a00820 [Penicillium oxalicum]
MADYDNDNGRYADEPRYDRDRSASPRDEPRGDRARSRSPNGRAEDSRPGPLRKAHLVEEEDEEGAQNTGSNLFVTGIHPRLTESDISRLFEKYGDVSSCSIMLDPHTKESRGFGFVNMSTAEQADAAKEGLQGEVIEGRTLSIEKARRSRPRTPTPGKYFGPPKRDDGRGPPRRGDRYDDRRGPMGGGGGGWRRRDDDHYRGGRYDSYNDRRDYGRDYGRDGGRGDGGYRRDYGGRDYRRESRDDHGYRGGPDRYGDRYSRDDRRGGDDRRAGGAGGAPPAEGGAGGEGRGYYDRDANPPSYDAAPPREPREPYSGGGRSYEGRGGDDRYGSR